LVPSLIVASLLLIVHSQYTNQGLVAVVQYNMHFFKICRNLAFTRWSHKSIDTFLSHFLKSFIYRGVIVYATCVNTVSLMIPGTHKATFHAKNSVCVSYYSYAMLTILRYNKSAIPYQLDDIARKKHSSHTGIWAGTYTTTYTTTYYM
jgi:hypothetical protein